MMSSSGVLNFNVGVLGHVDSGKTSLSKALSTVASTASFDKNPQSRERGITLDLGFSSFVVSVPESKKDAFQDYHSIQYTLVDCPGHASLIRTVIGGAQIIDLMLLVLDLTKGMQTQTAECLLIGEITCKHMIVVLNKLDMIPADKQTSAVEKMKKRMWKTLEGGPFAACPIVAVAANPGGAEVGRAEAMGVEELVRVLKEHTFLPLRSEAGPFVFSADHCFSIRGQGTVLTGTVLSGSASVNDMLEIPSMGTSKKIKSMQMFRKPVEKIKQGDRAGICMTQFDPKLLERGLACSAGALVTTEALVVSLEKVTYFKGPVSSKSKFHITIGHETVMGRLALFGLPPSDTQEDTKGSDQTAQKVQAISLKDFNWNQEYQYLEEAATPLPPTQEIHHPSHAGQFALLELEHPVTCPPSSLIIGSRLDADVHTSTCRIAFHGRVLEAVTDSKYRQSVLPRLRVFKWKSREGMVERTPDKYTVIGKNLFKKETNLASFANLRVTLSSGEAGVIEGGFGQSGKVKIRIPEGLSEETFQRYSATGKKKGKAKEAEAAQAESVSDDREPVRIMLRFKRFMYDPNKTMVQA